MTAPAQAAPAVAAAAAAAGEPFGPWHPGIESQLPRALLPLSTMFQPENSRTSVTVAGELHDLTGLDIFDLVVFRPERLALHELLIRVTADLSVPSGSRVEDLGINFRSMVNTLLANYIDARMTEVVATYDRLRQRLATLIDAELATKIYQVAATPANPSHKRSGFRAFLRTFGRPEPPASSAPPPGPEDAVVAWKNAANDVHGDRVLSAAYRALAKVVGALVGRHGAMWGTQDLVAALATDLACNDACSDAIGRLIEPWLAEGARKEGFRMLPAQAQPVIMNTKGASAAGKSTMRPEQRILADRIGVAWSDFALISPDIWRKQLLDYASLGPMYKYAGACTSEELEIIDQKLDRHMARKAQRLATTHLLIDRFRFDSFATESAEAGSNLLTRFGHTVYLFFLITPPESIVERAWQRGLEVGRYKAVDDLLAHSIEAYVGMPQLFFTWTLRADKAVHCEFLDNTVPFGERPRTIAFGWNGELNVLDVNAMLNMQGFRKVNVNAAGPGDLYVDPDALDPAKNTDFLVECARRLPALNFAEQATGKVYLRLVAGAPAWADAAGLGAALNDPGTRAGLLAVAPSISAGTIPEPTEPLNLASHLGAHRVRTLGRWGTPA